MINNILIQFTRFVGVSGIGWILDFFVYILMSRIIQSLFLCNVIGNIAGGIFVFTFSTRFVFVCDSNVTLEKKCGMYLLYLICAIVITSKILQGINSFILKYFSHTFFRNFSIVICKILITPITMGVNFLVLKKLTKKGE